jgi:molybdopterin molybdotransferase
MAKHSKQTDGITTNDSPEIDEGAGYLGYQDALNLVYANVHSVGTEKLPLDACTGRIVVEDLIALVDNPSTDVSLKDGFAVKSEDIAQASAQHPVRLPVIGSVFAGEIFPGELFNGAAVKICSGSPIPCGADAVVAEEFCEEITFEVVVKADAEPGWNILRAGEEIKAGATIIEKGKSLLPGYLGLAAVGGISHAIVYRKPKVAVIAIGDEVVAPGKKLHAGQLYASNLVTTCAWLTSYSILSVNTVIGDDKEAIRSTLLKYISDVDVVITSGGAWDSERDLVVGILDTLGWHKFFHHVRMGPGKGISFGLLNDKPVFCLPGGPASHEKAFLQFSLPGIVHMGGQMKHPLQTLTARLTQDMKSRHLNWTEFKDAYLSQDADGNYLVTPYRNISRLKAIAKASCLICIPEGKDSLHAGDMILVQLLTPNLRDLELAP